MALATTTTVVLELMTMGQQSAAHLRELLRAASPPVRTEHQALAAEILRCCDRVIAAMSAAATGKKRKMADPDATSCHPPAAAMPCKRRCESSPGWDDPSTLARGAEAHREVQSGTTADGFVWRKYGQKDINGSKHPRLYYRCAFSGEGCRATRRVQRSQEVPAAFVMAYYGEHTCGSGFGDACQQGAAPLPPTVVDFGSSTCEVVCAVDRSRGSPLLPVLPAEHGARRYGEVPGNTSRGWLSPSSSSYSSEVELGASPVQEFLEGSFDWEWEKDTTADGFEWRKYGQKDINGSKHPRLYYRCAFSGEGCRATRRVQRSQEEPAAFVIAYYGEHTCGAGFGGVCQQGAAPVPPTVVDSGSSACGIFGAFVRNRGSPLLSLLPAEHGARRHGEAPSSNTSRGWLSPSSSSYSSEVELGTSPVQEFLQGSFDWEWETVVNSLSSGDLLQ